MVTLHNPGFPAAEVSLKLDGGIGLENDAQKEGFVVRQLYPKKGLVKSLSAKSSRKPLRWGDELTLQLRPFEVVILEIGIGLAAEGWPPCRETLIPASQKLNANLEIVKAGKIPPPQPKRSDTTGYSEKCFRSWIELPDISGSRSLAFIIRLSRLGEHWYHKEICSLFSVEAAIGNQKLDCRKTPDSFSMNGPGSPWLLFAMDVDAKHSAKTLEIEAKALLPEEIDWQLECWLYRR